GRWRNWKRFAALLILRVDGVAVVRLTAPWRGGMRDVAALNAANSKAARPGHADDGKRNNDSRLTCANSSWTRSTKPGRSGPCSEISALPPTRCSVSLRLTRSAQGRLRPP